ncbi:MAG TPA: winged helix-turn-helix domain-containing protein, partial [Pyrinomonadaceae bacterium]|nr:winged helix-turn-helix domain-containing protein [Pyrinomonadaceae bacterium]
MNEMSDAAALLAFDDIVVDAEDFTVTKSGELVTLTPRAFDVLAYLVRNPGRVVEKQEIFDAIWKDTFVTDNALTRVMKEIRGVLGDRATEPRYIETVHKRGYRFIAEVSVGGRDRGRPSATGPIGSANAASQPVARKRSFPKYLPHVIGFFVAVAAIAGFYAGQNRTTFRSIAVLPLTNESGDANVEYLADGITETLIGSLSQ